MISKKFYQNLKKIVDNLEKERIKIYNEKIVPWEIDDKKYANNQLIKIITYLNNLAEYIRYMNFEGDEKNE